RGENGGCQTLTPPQEGCPMERLLAVLGGAVQFAYTCWDRIVLSGYLERLQRPENLIYFFQNVVGVDAIEPVVFEQRTNAYKAWVRRITEERGIPVLAAPRGVRKEELVEPYYRRLRGDQGVACVLTSLEQGRTFVSYVPRWKVPSGDANYRFIKACRKQFLHYYWYVLDPVMGPMSVRVASYFPFNVTCYLNGHSFVAQELTRAGVRFRKADNAFLAVSDVPALQAAADRLTAAVLQRRCTYWVRRVVPVFSPDEREALRPGYRYSMAQMELATDVVFKRSAPLRALFLRACELGVLVGGANRTTHLFGRRINRHYKGKLQTVLDQRDAGRPVLRWYYQTSFAKQYVRGDQHSDRILRTETCSNDTYHFGVGRRLDNLPLLHDQLAATNERCLAEQAELLASAVDTGQLAALAAPTLIGQRRVPGLKLHDDRVIRLLETLLHPGGFVRDWTSRELHTRVVARHRLTGDQYRLSQLRYDLSKLRAKGLVERIGKSRRYCLTPIGLKLGVLLVKLRTRLLGPLASLIQQPNPKAAPRHFNSVDAAYREIDTALDHLSAALGLQLAA
ncbi:MAG: hypothetical protein LC749_05225, partial [Actinobacteria bacterium]|nr:hypothetical protein [Actinomycetota bacterium]